MYNFRSHHGAALFVENPNLAGNAKWIATIVFEEEQQPLIIQLEAQF